MISMQNIAKVLHSFLFLVNLKLILIFNMYSIIDYDFINYAFKPYTFCTLFNTNKNYFISANNNRISL